MKTARRTNPLLGMLVLAIAAVLLAQALGALPAGAFDWISRGAPALLIVLGLAFLLRDRIPFGSIFALLLTSALVVGVAYTAYQQRSAQVRTENQQVISQAVGTPNLLRIRVVTLATQIDMVDSPSGGFVSGEFVGSVDNRVDVTFFETDDGSGTLTLTEQNTTDIPTLDTLGRGTLRLELPPFVPIDLELIGVEGDTTLNLNALLLERVNVTLSRGNLVVTLPDYTPQSVTPNELNGALTTGDGNLTLFVPAGVSARLELNRGGSGIAPEYEETIYNYLVGDVLEARNILAAETIVRYTLTAPRGTIRVGTTQN